jgi:hypothetical protein
LIIASMLYGPIRASRRRAGAITAISPTRYSEKQANIFLPLNAGIRAAAVATAQPAKRLVVHGPPRCARALCSAD